MISNTENTYSLFGKNYPISGQVRLRNKENNIVGHIPIVDIPMPSDYGWQLRTLKSRFEHPEDFERWEDVKETVMYLKNWLEEHKTQATVKELCEFETLKLSYNL